MNELHTQQALTVNTNQSVDVNTHSQSNGHSVDNHNVTDKLTAVTSDKADNKTEASAGHNPFSEEQVEQAVAKLNDYVQQSERKLEFKVDDDSGQTVVRVFNKGSDELIRQIPNEEALELAKRLSLEEPLVVFSAQV